MATAQSARARTRVAETDDGADDPALPQKKRARHRLIGALVVCLVAAVAVPLLLESEPTRPPAADVPVKVAPREPGTSARGPIEPGAEARENAARDGASKAADSARDPIQRLADAADARARTESASTAKPGTAAKDPAATKDPPAAKDPTTAKDSATAKESTTGKGGTASKAEAGRRYVLQVGAFSADAGANAAVERVRAAGQQAYTERVKTDSGVRVRVRLGPFTSREAAEQARASLKAAGIDAALVAP
jgi:DedD protein